MNGLRVILAVTCVSYNVVGLRVEKTIKERFDAIVSNVVMVEMLIGVMGEKIWMMNYLHTYSIFMCFTTICGYLRHFERF